MKFSSLAVSAMSLPILLSSASPIERPVRRQAPSYSVVAVDGGSPAAATTVTATASTLPPTTKLEVTTLFSTIVLTEIPTPTTIVLTITSTAIATVMETIATTIPSAATGMPAAISFSTITISPSYTWPTPVTVTETPSSVPYDNGMWHTTYWHAATPSATTDNAIASATATPGSLIVSPYSSTGYNFTAPPPMPPSTNLTLPLNWTAPVNYTNARLRLV